MTVPRDRTVRARARANGAAATAPPTRWLWLVAAPLAWALHEVVSYSGASIACHAGKDTGASRLLGIPAPNLVVAVVSLAALGMTTLATARLWHWWRTHPCASVDGESPRAERRRFLALLAAALGVLCTYGVLLAATATFLRGCT